jgi:hypothetical protein
MKAGIEKSKRVVLLFAFLYLFAGCDGSKGELPTEEDPAEGNVVENVEGNDAEDAKDNDAKDTEDTDIENSVIYFMDISIEEAQQLIKGKWLKISETDFSGRPHDMASDSLYIEIVDAETFRSNDRNHPEMKEYKIVEWKRNDLFGDVVEMIYAKNEDDVYKYKSSSYIFLGISCDSLYCGVPVFDGPNWKAVRVHEEEE